MAVSLRRIDVHLKNYLRDKRLPDIYEALLSGLAIMCPDDPYEFILEKLRHLQQHGLDDLEWDSFIDASAKPAMRVMKESSLDFIFDPDMQLDYEVVPSLRRLLRAIGYDQYEPSTEMYEKAHSYYNQKLKQDYFRLWMQFHLLKVRKKRSQKERLDSAVNHHNERVLRLHVKQWMEWFRFRKGRQAMAYNMLRHVYEVSVGRLIFRAWQNEANDAKLTREYFERLERGDVEHDESLGYGGGEARDEISMLSPKRLAIKIFSYLDLADLARCARVCRSWKVLTQSSALWSSLDITKVKHKVTDRATSTLLLKSRPYLLHLNLRGCDVLRAASFVALRACRNLQDLNLSECPTLDDEMLCVVTEGCRILLYLNVSRTHVANAGLRHVAENCENLQYLSLAVCPRFTDKGLEYLSDGKCAPKLIYLDLTDCTQVTFGGFQRLADGCPNLTSLVLDDLPVVDDAILKEITEKCKDLSSVSLLGSPNVTDCSIKKLTSNKKLRKLKIENSVYVTDAAFKHAGKQCPDLRHVHVIDCPNITDHTLRAIATCRNLTTLNLADCVRLTDAAVKLIAESSFAPKVRELNFSNCMQVGDISIICLHKRLSETGVRLIIDSPCGASLRELNLSNCLRIGDLALVGIHKRCKQLAYLSVCFCERITDTGIELLGQTRSLCYLDVTGCSCGDAGLTGLGNNPRLRDVSLSECFDVTDLGLQKFAQRCSDIERLDLSHCQQLTDAALKTLAFSCRMLTSLNVAGCRLLTDLTLKYLSAVCHYLRRLDISGSLFMSDKGLQYLRKGCRRLQTLVLLYCRSITKHGARKMRRHVANVRFTDEQPPYPFDYVVY